MKREFVKELTAGMDTNSKYAIRQKFGVNKYKDKGGHWFSLTVGDNSGDINLKYWGKSAGNTKSVYGSLSVGDVISITGSVKEYQDEIQINIDENYNTLEKVTEYDAEDYVPTSSRDLDALSKYLLEMKVTVKDEHLKKLLDKFFDDEEFMKEFKRCPGAKKRHHPYLGGLLEHTVGVLELCEAVSGFYPWMDRNLLMTGAMLHDIGKMREYAVGTSIEITDEGRLRGHIPIGEEMLHDKIKTINDFPKELAMKLSHMIISHHGELEWGSPRRPKTPEAAALHYADYFDSQLKTFLEIEDNGEKWIFDRKLDRWIYMK
ncbi:3'-5' exoribonuclease YhaM family protein [Candidatus Undinarchaeota archaeon]